MKDIKDIRKLTLELGEIYFIEWNYGSRASVYSRALADDIITKEQYNLAVKYYGDLWFFVGD